MFAIFNLSTAEWTILLSALLIGLPLVSASVLAVGYVAWQARRRGYSFWVWLLANVVSLNPLLILLVLVMLPDARKKALRAKEMRELEAKLAAARPLAVPAFAAPALEPADQSTAAPAQRSVGDEETRAY